MPPSIFKIIGFSPRSSLVGILLLCVISPVFSQIQINLKSEVGSFSESRSKLFRANCEILNTAKYHLETTELSFELSAEAQLLSPSLLKIPEGTDSLRRRNFKFLLNKSELNKDSILLKAVLRSFGTDVVLAEDSLWIQVKRKTPVIFKQLKSDVFIEAGVGLLPLSLTNPNSFPIDVDVSLYTPAAYFKTDYSLPSIRIAPKQDTFVLFPVSLKSGANAPVDMPVFLKISQSEKEGFRVAHFKLFQQKSRSRFIPVGQKVNFAGSFSGDIGMGDLVSLSRFNFSGAGKVKGKEVKIRISPAYFFGRNQLTLYNSHVELKDKRNHLQIGNFQYDDELLLNGKSLFFERKYDDLSMGVGVVNSNSNLLSFSNSSKTEHENSVRFRVKNRISSRWNSKMILMGQTARNSNIGLGQIEFERKRKDDRLLFGFSAGSDLMQNSGERSGFSGKMEYSKKVGNWRFFSKNYFSQKNHPGVFRGQLRLNERISYSGFKKWNLGIAGNINKYTFQNSEFSNGQKTQLTDWNFLRIQASRPLGKSFEFWMTPHIFQQKLKRRTGQLSFQDYSSVSRRFKFGFRKKYGQFTFDTDFDPGIYQSFEEGRRINTDFSFRSVSAVKYKKTGFNVIANRGSYFLFEEVEGYPTGTFLSGILRHEQRFFKKRIATVWSGQWTYDEERKRNVRSFDLRVSGDLPGLWRWNAGAFILNSGDYINSVFNFGVQKSFARYIDFSNRNRLKLVLFFDENQNGQKDKNEKRLQGVFVRIGSESLVSDDKGIVVLKGLPKGEFDVQITDPANNYAPVFTKIVLEKNKTIELGLTQPSIITGTVNLIREKFSDDRVSTSGVKIKLLNTDGTQSFTYTDEEGNYKFVVPQGSYYVQIDGSFSDRRFKIENNFQKVVFSEESKTQIINFNVTVRSRKTKIKYFKKKK